MAKMTHFDTGFGVRITIDYDKQVVTVKNEMAKVEQTNNLH